MSNKINNKICSRCELPLLTNPLGGRFNGVICLHHRCCIDCWFEKNDKGQRKYESDITKNIPLVENPFKNNDPKCIGCWKGLKNYINDIENISKHEIIIIDN